jgi:hypothetical protein
MTNYIKKLLAGALFGLVCITPAMAAETIQWNPGGSIVEFIEHYTTLRQVEGKLKVDGACISACTLFLGLVPEKDVCATPFGLLGFHSASVYNQMTGERKHSESGTRLIWNYYPKKVKDALILKHWDAEDPKLSDHNEIIYFPATDFVKACD